MCRCDGFLIQRSEWRDGPRWRSPINNTAIILTIAWARCGRLTASFSLTPVLITPANYKGQLWSGEHLETPVFLLFSDCWGSWVLNKYRYINYVNKEVKWKITQNVSRIDVWITVYATSLEILETKPMVPRSLAALIGCPGLRRH